MNKTTVRCPPMNKTVVTCPKCKEQAEQNHPTLDEYFYGFGTYQEYKSIAVWECKKCESVWETELIVSNYMEEPPF